MSIPLNKLGKVYIVCGKTDMRQGIDSLAYWIQHHYQLDPFSGKYFYFVEEKKIDLKHSIGMEKVFWLLYKRFENGKLIWPSNEKEGKRPITRYIE